MIMVYLMLGLAPVCIIYMIVSASKRDKVTKRAKRAGGVTFKHRDPWLLSRVRYSLAWILITAVNLLTNMKKVGYGSIASRKQVIFYVIAMVLYVMIFLFSLQQYLKYDRFRLCANCFYLGGTRYKRKDFSYSIDGDTVIFKANSVEKRIVIPEKKRKEVLGILGEYYTKDTGGQTPLTGS